MEARRPRHVHQTKTIEQHPLIGRECKSLVKNHRMTGYKSCSDSVLPVADDPGSRSWFLATERQKASLSAWIWSTGLFCCSVLPKRCCGICFKAISSRCKNACFLPLKQINSLCCENERARAEEIQLERQVAEQKGCTDQTSTWFNSWCKSRLHPGCSLHGCPNLLPSPGICRISKQVWAWYRSLLKLWGNSRTQTFDTGCRSSSCAPVSHPSYKAELPAGASCLSSRESWFIPAHGSLLRVSFPE